MAKLGKLLNRFGSNSLLASSRLKIQGGGIRGHFYRLCFGTQFEGNIDSGRLIDQDRDAALNKLA
jgi:hypothetical protein